MELITNAKCQLIVKGLLEKVDGNTSIELIVQDDNWDNYIISVNREEEYFTYEMPSDGLYIYYSFMIPTNSLPQDYDKKEASGWLKWIKDDPTHPEYNKEELQLFSICKLRNCVLKLEREHINWFVENYHKKNLCKKTSGQTTKDFLLISIFVLENLICQQRFTEADSILKSLGTCEDVCGERKLKQSCGCNGN